MTPTQARLLEERRGRFHAPDEYRDGQAKRDAEIQLRNLPPDTRGLTASAAIRCPAGQCWISATKRPPQRKSREERVTSMAEENALLRERVRLLESAIDTHEGLPWAILRKLGPNELRIMNSLLYASPKGLTAEQLFTAAYFDDPTGGPLESPLHVHLVRLRQKLRPFGIEIETCRRPSAMALYRLGPDSISKIGALLADDALLAAALAAPRPISHLAQERLRVLTPRQREVVMLAVDGVTNKEVGRRLGISHRTAEVHRHQAMKKIRARNLSEMVNVVFAGAAA